MNFKGRKGQTLVEYFLLSILVMGLIFTLVPLFRQANTRIATSSAPTANKNLNQEGIITDPLVGTMIPGTTTSTTTSTPLPPSPTNFTVGEHCGPAGCGTLNLGDEEALCGIIPGAAGPEAGPAHNDGCWICDNHGSNFWYWESPPDPDFATKCRNYWTPEVPVCDDQCPSHYPDRGNQSDSLGNYYCHVCTNSGTNIGFWQRRGYSAEPNENPVTNTTEGIKACDAFWSDETYCFNSDITYAAPCGNVIGVPPMYGYFQNPAEHNADHSLANDVCWIAYNKKWINTTQEKACVDMWLTDTCPSSPDYNPTDNTDYPYCGSAVAPLARGLDIDGTGGCWVNNSGNWVWEADSSKCTNFWVRHLCPTDTASASLTCGDFLQVTNPGPGKCWLCTDPTEYYRKNPSDWGQPCTTFWTNTEYPAYLDIPNDPDDVDTVCADELPLTDEVKKPGIVNDLTNNQWGCWLCTVGGNYNWVYWNGNRFDDITGSQYQACHNFWMEGLYPLEIPPSPDTLPNPQWVWEYGGTANDYGNSIVVSGKYLYVSGTELSDSFGGSDIFVMKMEGSTGKILWKKHYGEAFNDGSFSIAVSPLGNFLYVTGYEEGDSTDLTDIFVMKLNSVNGAVGWKKRHGGAGYDGGKSIAVAGNYLYVTGIEHSDPDGGQDDIFVMKMDTAGNVKWENQYGGAKDDKGRGIVVSGGYIYVTGIEDSDPQGGGDDIFVMKIEDSAGKVLWKKQYGGTGNDIGCSIAISDNGQHLYVTGVENSDPVGSKDDIVVMRMDSTSGSTDWKKRYGGTDWNGGNSITVSGDYLYVTGYKQSASDGGDANIVVMKINELSGLCDGTNGTWKNQYGGASRDTGNSIAVSSDGNYIYVAGSESSDPDGGGNDIFVMKLKIDQDSSNITDWNEADLTAGGWIEATIAYDINGLNGWSLEGFNIDTEQLKNGVDTWVDADITGWPPEAYISKDYWPLEGVILDPETDSSPPIEEGLDWTYLPPIPSPNQPWRWEYGGAGNDASRSIVISPDKKYLYVTGYESSDPRGGGDDILVMKMQISTGQIIWKNQYGGKKTDMGMSIAISPGGKTLYVAGHEASDYVGGYNDIVVMSMDSDTGHIYWKRQYGGTNFDTGWSIAVSPDGKYLYITGSESSDPQGGGDDIFVMRIRISTSQVKWEAQYGGAKNDYGHSIAVAPNGNYLYVTGTEASDSAGGSDIFVMKMQAGHIIWKKRYGGANDEYGYSIAVSALGDYLYVTGMESSASAGGGKDIVVMKIKESNGDCNGSNGTWKRQYGGANDDYGKSIVVSPNGNYLYVTGIESSDPAGGEKDIVVMKIRESDGLCNGTNETWKNQYGGAKDEYGYSIAVSDDGKDLYIAGSESSDPDGGGYDILVMKLKSDQTSSNITAWTIGDPIAEGDNGWTEANIPYDLTGLNGWSLEGGANLDDEQLVDGVDTWVNAKIKHWPLEGDILNDELISKDYWPLEGVILNAETGSSPPYEEGLDWSQDSIPQPLQHPWAWEYGGTGDEWGNDIIISPDGQYLYVTGQESSDSYGGGANADIVVMKMDMLTGKVLWKNQYGGASRDIGNSIAISPNGNYLYVTGSESSDSVNNYDIFVMKLNSNNGVVLWKNRHGGIDLDGGESIAVSPVDGSIYVTGSEYSDAWGAFNLSDIFVMKMDTAGNIKWENHYGGLDTDTGTSIAISPIDGSLYVTGQSAYYGEYSNIFVMKMDPVTGKVGWKKQYGGTSEDGGKSIIVSADGQYLYVTGNDKSVPGGGGYDIVVMKIKALNGVCDGTNGTWKRQYGGAKSDVVFSIAVSPDGQYLYVTGNESSDSVGNEDIVVMKIRESDGLCNGTDNTWKNHYGGANSDAGFSIAVSADGLYLYVSGREASDPDGGGYDMVVMKIDANQTSSNITAWTVGDPIAEGDGGWTEFDIPYDSTGVSGWALEGTTINDEKLINGKDTWVDASIVAGTGTGIGFWTLPGDFPLIHEPIRNAAHGGDGWTLEGVTLDLETGAPPPPDQEGLDWPLSPIPQPVPQNQPWEWEYGGTGNDIGESIVISPDGKSLYVTGYESSDPAGGAADIFVMKMDVSTGKIIWKNQYGGIKADVGFSIAVSPLGDYLYVTGYENSDPTGGYLDIFVMKVNASTGIIKWKNQHGGVSGDAGFSIAVSPLGNYLYVIGRENSDSIRNYDIFIMKMSSSIGQVLWENSYGSMGDDEGYSIAVSPDGSLLYVTGHDDSDTNEDTINLGAYHDDVFVMKIDASTAQLGRVLWKKYYGGTSNDFGKSIAVSPAGNYIYVTGKEFSDSAGLYDIFVMRMDPAGNILWKNHYGGAGDDVGYSIAVSPAGDYLYVTGSEGKMPYGGTNSDIVVMKIRELTGVCDGTYNTWKYHYGGDGDDEGKSIAASADGNFLYVTGYESSDPDGGGADIVVMRLNTDQGSSNILDWTAGGPLGAEWVDAPIPVSFWRTKPLVNGINTWVDAPIKKGTDFWTLEGDAPLNDEIIRPDKGFWTLEGITLNAETGSSPPMEEGLQWDFLPPIPKPKPSTTQPTWAWEYGGAGSDFGESIVISPDGLYLYVTGSEQSASPAGGFDDIFVMKMDMLTGKILWKNQYGGALNDFGGSIAISSDGAALYVTGSESSNSINNIADIFVMKLNPDNGIVLWKNRHGGGGLDRGYSIIVSGNDLYVTGKESSDPRGGGFDIFVMKMDTGGNITWEHQYGGADWEVGDSIAVSPDGSFYLTGMEESDHTGGSADIFVMKMDPAGKILWKNQYGGSGDECGNGIAVSPIDGSLYVTGYESSDPQGGGVDIVIMKLDTSGNVIWKNQYGGINVDDGNSIIVSPDGQYLYVTGEESSDTGGGGFDIVVMKIDTSGNIVWKNQYGGAGDEEGRSIAVSADGTYLYVTGWEDSDPDGGGRDIVVMKLKSDQTASNITQWTVGGSITDGAGGWLEAPIANDTYGWSLEGVDLNDEIIKNGANGWIDADILYQPSGINGWSLEGVTLDDEPIPDGDTGSVTGWTLEGTVLNAETGTSPPMEEGLDWDLSHPSPHPTPPAQWAWEYGGTGTDVGYSIIMSPDGKSLYVTGFEMSDPYGGQGDIFVMKMNPATGTVIWKNQYGGALSDRGYSIAVSPNGHYLYVTGCEKSDTAGDWDIFVMKLDMANGYVLWKNRRGGTGNDEGNSIVVSPDGKYLYVTGMENSYSQGGYDIFVMKMDSAIGYVLWINRYGGDGDDYGNSIAISPNGQDLYVTGSENPWIIDYILVAELPTNGGTGRMTRYGGTGMFDEGYSIAVSADGQSLYVTGGETSDSAGDRDVFVMKLNTGGGVAWKNHYGGTGNDRGSSIAIKGTNLYVTGYTEEDGSNDENIFVMKLNGNGGVVWKNKYGGTGNERGKSIAVSPDGTSLYVTGYESSDPDGGGDDIVVMKLKTDQTSSNITYWIVEGPIIANSTNEWVDNAFITPWTSGDITGGGGWVNANIRSGDGFWTLGGLYLDQERIRSGPGFWTLEGTTLNPETGSSPPEEEGLTWW